MSCTNFVKLFVVGLTLSAFSPNVGVTQDNHKLDQALEQLKKALAEAPRSQTAPLLQTFTQEEIAEILRLEGFGHVEMVRKNALKFKIEGLNVMMYIYNDGDIQLRMGLTGDGYSVQFVNEWNRVKRNSKAYLDTDQDVFLESDLDSGAGLTVEHVAGFVSTFRTALSIFRQELRTAQSQKKSSAAQPVADSTQAAGWGLDVDERLLERIARIS